MKNFETPEAAERLLEEWGDVVLERFGEPDERLREWLAGRLPDGHNELGLMGDLELMLQIAVDIRQFMGAGDNLDAANAAVVMVGKVMDLVMVYGLHLNQQAPLDTFYRQLHITDLTKFADSLETEATKERVLVIKYLRWCDDVCSLYGDTRPFSRYYEKDQSLRESCVKACEVATTEHAIRRIPVGDGPYGNGVHGPDWSPDEEEKKEEDGVPDDRA